MTLQIIHIITQGIFVGAATCWAYHVGYKDAMKDRDKEDQLFK